MCLAVAELIPPASNRGGLLFGRAVMVCFPYRSQTRRSGENMAKQTVSKQKTSVADAERTLLAPPNRGSFNSTHVYGTHVPVEEPSTASIADIQPFA